jgi:hypothetical protein
MTELTEKEPTDIKLYELLRSIVTDAGGCQSQKLRGICCAPDEYCSCACNAYDRIVASGYALVPLEGAVERVARAIAVSDGCSPDEALIDGDRFTGHAQAAIKALTEEE